MRKRENQKGNKGEKEGGLYVRKGGNSRRSDGMKGDRCEEGTIGGKSGRPRKRGRDHRERGETVPYKTETRGEKEICIAGACDWGRGREREIGRLSQYTVDGEIAAGENRRG